MSQVWIIVWRIGERRSVMGERGEVLFGWSGVEWGVRCWDIFPQSSTSNQPVVDFHNNGAHFPVEEHWWWWWWWCHLAATATMKFLPVSPILTKVFSMWDVSQQKSVYVFASRSNLLTGWLVTKVYLARAVSGRDRKGRRPKGPRRLFSFLAFSPP